MKAAITLLTAASAVLWTLPLWDRISNRADLTDGLAAATLTVSAVVAACSSRAHAQRERERAAWQRDRAAYTRILADFLSQSPGGDGGHVPQQAERPRWYLKVPA